MMGSTSQNSGGKMLRPSRPVRIHQFDEYTRGVLERPLVKQLLSKHNVTQAKIPSIYSSDTCGVNIAGQTWINISDEADIELSSWILVAPLEAKRVIRHELAHVIKHICSIRGTTHGKGFNIVLKTVCPRTWRKDKHWYPTKKIDIARKKIHPRLKE